MLKASVLRGGTCVLGPMVQGLGCRVEDRGFRV